MRSSSALLLAAAVSQQWQFAVPTAAPANVGASYGNVVVSPLQATVIPLAP